MSINELYVIVFGATLGFVYISDNICSYRKRALSSYHSFE